MKPYTVNAAPIVKAALPGTDEFIRQIVKRAGGALWNNGSYQMRDVRNRPGQISNHAKGLAVDFSYRKMTNKGLADGRKMVLPFLRQLIINADVLEIELVIDYFKNRSWRCDRGTWIKGKWVGGDWLHVEISVAMANDKNRVKQAFSTVFGDNPDSC